MREFGLVCLFGMTSFDDIRTKEVRLIEIIAFGFIGVLINLIEPMYSLSSIIGGILLGAIIYVYSIVSNEKIGKGDALIIIVASLYLGYMNTLILLWISSVIALIAGIIIIKRRSVTGSYEIPFAPFLLVGFLAMYSINMIRGVL